MDGPKRYWKLCALYFVTQAALQRHKRAKVCRTMNIECWLNDDEGERLVPDEEDERSEVLELNENSDLRQLQVEPAADVNQARRNVFDLFVEQFEECTR